MFRLPVVQQDKRWYERGPFAFLVVIVRQGEVRGVQLAAICNRTPRCHWIRHTGRCIYTALMKLIRECFACRGDPGRWGGTVARELRRQSGWRLRDLQWVRWVQKGKSPRSLFVCGMWLSTTCSLCDVLAPAFHSCPCPSSIPLSSVLLWKKKKKKKLLRATSTKWCTICFQTILCCFGKQRKVLIFITPCFSIQICSRFSDTQLFLTVFIDFWWNKDQQDLNINARLHEPELNVSCAFEMWNRWSEVFTFNDYGQVMDETLIKLAL